MARHRDTMSTEDVLSSSPFDDELPADLEATPRRRRPQVTLYLGAVLLLIGGFAFGVKADQWWGPGKSGSATTSAVRGTTGGGLTRLAGRGGAGFGGGGSNGAAGGATVGTIKLVDGHDIYVTTASGGIVQVQTGPSTRITVAQPGTTGSLSPGQVVVVSGSTNADGSVTASTVTEGSAGRGGSGPAAGPGGG